MSEIEHEIQEEAADAAAPVAAAVAAEVAEHAATNAATEAVDDALEVIERVADRAEEAIEQQEDDAQWERMRTLLLEQENRILAALSQVATAMQEAASSGSTLEPTTPEPEALENLEDAATELAEAAEDAQPGDEVVAFDPLAIESAPEAERSGRRRPRGLGRRG